MNTSTTLPNAQLAVKRRNWQLETDNGLPEADLLYPTVTVDGLSTLQQLLYSQTSNVPAASQHMTAT